MPERNNPTIVPTMRYRDAPAAIDFLCRAFGFEKRLVVPGERGAVDHAQLTLDNGMIMLSSVKDGVFDQLMTHPRDTGGAETQCAYVIVADVDAHYRQAKATIVLDIKDQDYGGRLYTCRDPEGHFWNFGSYDSWR